MTEMTIAKLAAAAEVGVEVKNGVVTLAGHVASYGEKWDAERAAQRVARLSSSPRWWCVARVADCANMCCAGG